MRKFILLSALVIPFLNNSGIAQYCIPEEGDKYYEQAMQEINDKHVRWIKSTAAESRKTNSTPEAVLQQGLIYGNNLGLGQMDIDAMVSWVMMLISKDNAADIKKMLEDLKALNEQKKELRDKLKKIREYDSLRKEMSRATYDSLKRFNSSKPGLTNIRVTENVKPISPTRVQVQKVSAAEILNLKIELMEKLDSLNELSEEKSLRLQMYMDRYTKFLSSISNLFKKLSTSYSQIIQNLK